MRWQEALGAWQDRLAMRSAETADKWPYAIQAIFRDQGLKLESLTRADLEACLIVLHRRPLAPGTIQHYIEYMRLFLRFCGRNGWLPRLTTDDIIETLKSHRAPVVKPYEVLTDDEIERLFKIADQRSTMILACGIFAGLRISEILSLQPSDVLDDVRGPRLHVAHGKGGKSRDVPIDASVLALILPHVPVGCRVDRARFLVINCVAAAGIKRRITPHALRHTYAFRLAQAGTPIPVIQRLLGHSSLEMTSRYIDHLRLADLAKYAPVPHF